MKPVLILVLLLLAACSLALIAWRLLDHRADRAEMARLLAMQPLAPPRFDPAMVADLPDPVRRYFEHAILPGTPLMTVAEIDMTGQFAMGDKADPNYAAMRATQVLAAPHGFVWKMSARRGVMRMSGSDSGGWTRFWLAGLAPVGRFGGTSDHARSSFGRYIAEAVFWTPAALLPGPGVTWTAADENTARVTVTAKGLEQSVDISMDGRGQPVQVAFDRWSNANPDRTFRLQRFGGYLSGFREFQGFRLPTHVEAGNFFDSGDYFPFFIADVTDIRFLPP